MMTGGCERSEPEFASLLRCAGFQSTPIVRVDSTLCAIEARPR